MEDLKELLDGQSIEQIKTTLFSRLHTADGYGNQLKLVFALLTIMEESSTMLNAVDFGGFVDLVRRRCDELGKECEEKVRQYGEELEQDAAVYAALDGVDSGRIKELNCEITRLLEEYRILLGKIVRDNDSKPVRELIG